MARLRKLKLYSYLAVSSVPLKMVSEEKGYVLVAQLKEKDRQLDLNDYLDKIKQRVLEKLTV